MNLVIDCFKLVKGAGKSIGIYNLAKSITCHLGERVMQEDKAGDGFHIIVLGNAYNRSDFDVPGVTFVEMSGNPLNKLYCIWWELVAVRRFARRYDADRVLFPRGYRPMGSSGSMGKSREGKRIRDTIIIHDLIPFYYDKHYPGFFNRLENAYIMYRLRVSMKKADRIITISDYSRQEIQDKVSGCQDRITVINNGLNDVTFDNIEECRQPKVNGDYIVAMTSALPHKNAAGVLRAYECYYQRAEKPLDMAVLGLADLSAYPQMKQEAAAHVQCYKFFDKFEDMCRIAAGAKAYLFLSYAEGFGFPPLEAMQLGVPVVCSDCTSLPEVVGDAGLLVAPADASAAADALIKLTTDEALREEMIRKGYENIRRFSWESRTNLYWKELFR